MAEIKGVIESTFAVPQHDKHIAIIYVVNRIKNPTSISPIR
jgi:hypothetical protein